MNVIGVSKKFVTSSKSGKHPRAKKYWFVYYMDDDNHLHTKRLHWLQVPFYKIQTKKRVVFVCESCGYKFQQLVNRWVKEVSCPNGCDKINL